MNLKKILIFSTLSAVICFCTCCTHKPKHISLPAPIPQTFSKTNTMVSKPTPREIVLNKRWWESFRDAELNQMVEQVLSDNLNLKQAWARLEQSEALEEQARSFWSPQITANTGTGRSRINVSGPNGTTASYNNQFFVSSEASYEADVWGKISSSRKAAWLDVKAAQSDVDAMGMSLSAEVAETWFSIIEQNALLGLVQEQLKTNEMYLKLVQLRFGQGLVSSLDVYQQRQQAAGTRAQIPLLESRLNVLLHKLAVLMGQAPSADIVHIRSALPDLPDIPPIGLPSELLKFRPDIQAAQFRVASADSRAGAAVADRFPSLKLSASGGFRATELSELFENLVWDILGNVSATLWDGGRKNAEIKRTKAVLKERLAYYAQTALEAFQEVEDALVKEEYQRTYLKELTKQTEYSKKSLEEARSRYLSGLDDYLPVLTALTSLQNLEQNLISGKKQILSHRIQLCRALGGGWR